MDQGESDKPPEGTSPVDPGAADAGIPGAARHCLSDLRKCSQLRINVCAHNHIHIEFRDGDTNAAGEPDEDGRPYAEFVIRNTHTAYTVLAVLQDRINQMLIGSGEDAPGIH